MMNLDSLEKIRQLDSKNVLGSIEALPDQIHQVWDEIQKLKVPRSCPLAKNVVIMGMGGSALGGRIVDSLLVDRVRTPVEIFTDFHLPHYVNQNTLVILSSYSGNTEETLAVAHEALLKKAQIFGITTGGKLAQFLDQEKLSGYVFKPRHNPSDQPRMGLGYSIMAVLALLAKCEFLHLGKEEVKEIEGILREAIKDFGLNRAMKDNLAKTLAQKLKGKIPVLIASEHLVGSAHAMKNQFNENAKTFSVLFDLPELNHHLMEGLKNPALAKNFLYFLFLRSSLYSPPVQKRYPLTQEVVEKNEVQTGIFQLQSPKKITQIFEALVFGSFLSFYLAMLYDLDPAPIPWVDYFKKKL